MYHELIFNGIYGFVVKDIEKNRPDHPFTLLTNKNNDNVFFLMLNE